MASKTERRLKQSQRKHRPLDIETRARVIKKPKDDRMSPGRLVAVAEWVAMK